MLDTLIKLKFINVISNTVQGVIFTRIKKKTMNENPNEYEYCLKLALDNAKKRMIVLDGPEKKCVLDEYKEWINDGLSMHTVLLLREDPII